MIFVQTKKGWLVGLGQERVAWGWGDYLKYLNRGWNKKEKEKKQSGGKLDQAVGALKWRRLEPPYKLWVQHSRWRKGNQSLNLMFLLFYFLHSTVPDNRCDKQKWYVLFFTCVKIVVHVLAHTSNEENFNEKVQIINVKMETFFFHHTACLPLF